MPGREPEPEVAPEPGRGPGRGPESEGAASSSMVEPGPEAGLEPGHEVATAATLDWRLTDSVPLARLPIRPGALLDTRIYRPLRAATSQ